MRSALPVSGRWPCTGSFLREVLGMIKRVLRKARSGDDRVSPRSTGRIALATNPRPPETGDLCQGDTVDLFDDSEVVRSTIPARA